MSYIIVVRMDNGALLPVISGDDGRCHEFDSESQAQGFMDGHILENQVIDILEVAA